VQARVATIPHWVFIYAPGKPCQNFNRIATKPLLRGKIRFADGRATLIKTDKAMIQSSRRDRKTKAIAEVLAMMVDAHRELAPREPRPVRETDEWLWENATEFSAALEKYFAEHAMQIKRKNQQCAPLPIRARAASLAFIHAVDCKAG
jgi:hypothetical protein